MFVWPEKITYALPETIGNTDLFVGRIWMSYLDQVLSEPGRRDQKRIMHYLFQAGEARTCKEIRDDLWLRMPDRELEGMMRQMVDAGLITQGERGINYSIPPEMTRIEVWLQRKSRVNPKNDWYERRRI